MPAEVHAWELVCFLEEIELMYGLYRHQAGQQGTVANNYKGNLPINLLA